LRHCSQFNVAHFGRLTYRSSKFCIITQRNQRIALLASPSASPGDAVVQASSESASTADISATAQQLMVILCFKLCYSNIYQLLPLQERDESIVKLKMNVSDLEEASTSRWPLLLPCFAGLPRFFVSHLLRCSNFEIPLWSCNPPGRHTSATLHPHPASRVEPCCHHTFPRDKTAALLRKVNVLLESR
jgi:hypothetical protein